MEWISLQYLVGLLMGSALYRIVTSEKFTVQMRALKASLIKAIAGITGLEEAQWVITTQRGEIVMLQDKLLKTEEMLHTAHTEFYKLLTERGQKVLNLASELERVQKNMEVVTERYEKMKRDTETKDLVVMALKQQLDQETRYRMKLTADVAKKKKRK